MGGADDSDFNTRLARTELLAEMEIRELCAAMTDSERSDYRRRLSEATSLVEPHMRSRLERDAALKAQRDAEKAVEKAYLYGCVLLIAVIAIDAALLSGDAWRTFVVAITVLGGISYLGYQVWHSNVSRTYQVSEKYRELYQQKWCGLGLEWGLLSRYSMWKERDDSGEHISLRINIESESQEHQVEEKRLLWEVKKKLAHRVSDRAFIVDIGRITTGKFPDWSNVLKDQGDDS